MIYDMGLMCDDAKRYAYEAGTYRKMVILLIRVVIELLVVAPHIPKWQVVWSCNQQTMIPPIRKFSGSITKEDGINIILAKYGAIVGILADAQRLIERGVRYEEK